MNSNTEPSADLLRMEHSGMQAFVAIAKLWKLDVPTRCRVLGGISESAYFLLLKGSSKPNPNVLELLSLILGIWRDLEILIPDTEASAQWLLRPHSGPWFHNRSSFERILSGDLKGLVDVRRHLEEWRASI